MFFSLILGSGDRGPATRPSPEGSLFCLRNHFLDSLQVCLAAVGLVGDLCRALQSNILPFCDEVMQLLLENLGVSIYIHTLVYQHLKTLERWLNIKVMIGSFKLPGCWLRS